MIQFLFKQASCTLLRPGQHQTNFPTRRTLNFMRCVSGKARKARVSTAAQGAWLAPKTISYFLFLSKVTCASCRASSSSTSVQTTSFVHWGRKTCPAGTRTLGRSGARLSPAWQRQNALTAHMSPAAFAFFGHVLGFLQHSQRRFRRWYVYGSVSLQQRAALSLATPCCLC